MSQLYKPALIGLIAIFLCLLGSGCSDDDSTMTSPTVEDDPWEIPLDRTA